MIEHCISSFKAKQKELAFKVYMSDAVKVIAEMIFARFSGQKAELPRYYDQIQEPEEEEKPKETADDVINRIMGNLTQMGS